MSEMHICETCGKSYKVRPSTAIDSRFCSKRCQLKPHELQTGARFGRWTVIRFDRFVPRSKTGTIPHYLCECDCGTVKSVSRRGLVTGQSRSCGCLHREVSSAQAKALFTKHGRCCDPNYIRSLKRRRYHGDREWSPAMDALLFKTQPACVVCDSTSSLEADHVIPVIKGGRLLPGNAVVLCRSCNAIKHDKALDELPPDWQAKISAAALAFADAWQVVNGSGVGG
jgi:5-methylcytosine-specific restriction endonuclease McrA